MRFSKIHVLSLGLMLVSLSACGGNVSTPFSGDVKHAIGGFDDQVPKPAPGTPSDVHPTAYCKPDANGNFTESQDIQHGNAGAYYWGEGGGCVLRDVRETWAASMNEAVLTWDGTDKANLSVRSDLPAGAVKLLNMHYEVHKFFITVGWDMWWVHSVVDGTVANPERILINYKKVSGTGHIPYWEGSIYLTQVAPGVTGFSMRNQIHADQTGEDDAVGAISDFLRKLRTAAPEWGLLPDSTTAAGE